MQANTVENCNAFMQNWIRYVLCVTVVLFGLGYVIQSVDLMGQVAFPCLMIPLVGGIIFTIWWGIVKVCKYLNRWKDKTVYCKGIMFGASIIVAAVAFWILTGYWEWQKDGKTMYVHDGHGNWSRFDGKIYRGERSGFDGYNVTSEDLKKRCVSLAENSPFQLSYHLDASRIVELITLIGQQPDPVGPTSSLGNMVDQLIKIKSYKFFYLTPIDDLKNDALRLRLFATYYRQFGIVVDSVDFP